jgi:heterotetrameric sarcosine oxidase gamma subunit
VILKATDVLAQRGKSSNLLNTTELEVRECTELGGVMLSMSEPSSDLLKSLSNVIDCPLPESAGSITRQAMRRALWLSPRHRLLICNPADEAKLVDTVKDAFPDASAHAAMYSDALCWLELRGTHAQETLQQGGFIRIGDEFPQHFGKRTTLFEVPVLLIRDVHYQIAVERSRADYLLQRLEQLTFLGAAS